MTGTAQVSYPKTRRIAFGFTDTPAGPKHFAQNDIVFSHTVAFLSAIFPPGEDIFVRSVRRYRDKITDPDLKKRVAGFIGQEMTHGLQHRELNEQLAEMGYPTAWFEYFLQSTERMEKFLDKQYPDPDRCRRIRHLLLAFTVGAEHFTAVFAENVLGRPDIQKLLSDPEIRNMLNWHALEELEHKSVAFDVYRDIGASEQLRIRMMRLLSTIAVPAIVASSWVSIFTTDPLGRRQPLRLLRETFGMVRGPLFRGIYRDMKPFMRKGFHPDDIDTNALLVEWQERLFGAEGELVGHLK
ncbi:metal-dependent hydrolase [Mycobacteroides chelonae]|jgi:predicted metal-dependent hydrolase|uniref:Metal-dependent hydrolase n=1 Tax=Mycobacteroides chelonae TaxID=1774 RepID=A0AB73MSN5_MYCCH|nr:metal-dependent hydrolase [Mycobacteroides chelonae]MBF9329519.1 metal-dependent hydrolase [Mycobacteroides chelonae]MBF9424014.1 metal-dependent hydrolase [Mycobacteroides chelonae]MBF9437618.1 metal-dependent hydrolase [Mycobacteroides chelonae]MBV6358915.1 metal-dependent hydrolase [Mycobacteroides chelonae]MEC4835469.1 metal-dependent hydrolase [Mycobacteroides chelonae]